MDTFAVLASGGLDSFGAWASLSGEQRSRAVNVFVDIGQPYAAKEREALRRIASVQRGFSYVVEHGPGMAQHELPSGIIPFRNAALTLQAAQHGNVVVLGVLAGEINSDKSSEFMTAMQEVLDVSYRAQYWNGNTARKHKVQSNVRHLTKTGLVAHLLDLPWVDRDAVEATVSCYDGGDEHCGACPSCFKRWVAWVNNALPVDYFRGDPLVWAEEQGILTKMRDGTYSRERAMEIQAAVKRATG